VAGGVASSIKAGRPSWIGRAAFVALVLAYAVMGWEIAMGLLK